MWEYCELLGVGIRRSILSQQDEKLASGGVCGVLVELFVDPFHLLFWFLRSFSLLEERQDGLCQQW